MKLLILVAFLFSPVVAYEHVPSADMWWCSGCGLAYPASQKVCLNKDCPLFRKKR
ncbi:MAG: hypothetical protein JSS30_07230 [Verrucomicrobia bacterium]|nr:hypothetical protein [Verrucomicrobiota bacterium]